MLNRQAEPSSFEAESDMDCEEDAALLLWTKSSVRTVVGEAVAIAAVVGARYSERPESPDIHCLSPSGMVTTRTTLFSFSGVT